MQKQTQQFQII